MNRAETTRLLRAALEELRTNADENVLGGDMAAREYLLRNGLDFDAVASELAVALVESSGRPRESVATAMFMWGFAVAVEVAEEAG